MDCFKSYHFTKRELMQVSRFIISGFKAWSLWFRATVGRKREVRRSNLVLGEGAVRFEMLQRRVLKKPVAEPIIPLQSILIPGCRTAPQPEKFLFRYLFMSDMSFFHDRSGGVDRVLLCGLKTAFRAKLDNTCPGW